MQKKLNVEHMLVVIMVCLGNVLNVCARFVPYFLSPRRTDESL